MVKFVAASSHFQNVGNNDGGGNRARNSSHGEGSEGGSASGSGGSESGRGGNERHVQVWARVLIEVFTCTDRKFPELVDELVSPGWLWWIVVGCGGSWWDVAVVVARSAVSDCVLTWR